MDLDNNTFLFDDGSWVAIDVEEGGWEFQEDADDEETYCSGNFQTDDDETWQVIDYDGIEELPSQVIRALEIIGYKCEQIK